MEVEEKLKSKTLYKVALVILKILPMFLAFLSMLSTYMDYCNIDTTVISYLVMVALILFLYLVSYVFRFCAYHRMFLHYFVGVNSLSVYDTYIGIPFDDYELMQMYALFTGVCLFIILYLYVKGNKKTIREDN